jgi:hypothetical protein
VPTEKLSPVDQLIADLKQHLASRKLRETALEQEDKYKARLLTDLTEVGEETPEGHYVFSFDEGLGLADGRTVRSVKREKRAPLTLDPERLEEYFILRPELRDQVFKHTVVVPDMSLADMQRLMKVLEEIGLYAGCEHMEVIDDDALLELNYEDVIDDDVLKKMYTEPEKPVFALKVSYAKS